MNSMNLYLCSTPEHGALAVIAESKKHAEELLTKSIHGWSKLTIEQDLPDREPDGYVISCPNGAEVLYP